MRNYEASGDETISNVKPIEPVRPGGADERTDGPDRVCFRSPRAEDGPQISALIGACPPLDTNSVYCTLLQCTHFAKTCVLAERQEHQAERQGDQSRIAGWVSAYRPPAAPDELFVWQVAVCPSARGTGLGSRMLDELFERPATTGVTTLVTTITQDNAASWALFTRFARARGLSLQKAPLFERDAHFGGRHDTEWEVRIGPLQA